MTGSAGTEEWIYARSLGHQGNRGALRPSLPPLCDWAAYSDSVETLHPTVCPGLHKQ